MQHAFLHIVVRADDSLKTKISWMHFGRLPFTQNLRNFGNSGNCYSIFPEKFPDFRKRFRNTNHSTRNFRHSGAKLSAERKLPDDNFRKFRYILRKCYSTRYCMEVAENLKPEVVIEWNGAHAKVTKFVTNCAPFARARELH